MHIADVTMFYTPSSGGVRTYLEAKRLWLSGREAHTLVVPGARRQRTEAVQTVPAAPIPFGHGYRFPLRTDGWVESLVALRPDLIEVGDPYVTAWAALDAGRRLGVPVVGFYHSDLPRLIGSRIGRWSEPRVEAYVRGLYRRFDLVLAPSRVMVEKLRGLGIGHVELQPLGVDSVHFSPGRRDPALKRELGLDAGTPLLVFAGRASREKHIPLLLEAMERLGRGYHLLLVGPGMPRSVPGNVTVVSEYANRERTARYLASSDGLIHAGDSETFGLVVLEAMASGIPVIGTRAGAVAEHVVPGTGLLVEPGNAAALAEAARALFANGHRGMGRLARRRVEEHYTWDRVLERLLDRYRELTGQPAPVTLERQIA